MRWPFPPRFRHGRAARIFPSASSIRGLAIAAKRLLTGRLAAGVYPLWGPTYFRWWLAGKLGEMPDVYLLAATPWMPLYCAPWGPGSGGT